MQTLKLAAKMLELHKGKVSKPPMPQWEEDKKKSPKSVYNFRKYKVHDSIVCFVFFFPTVWKSMQNVFSYDSSSKVLPVVYKNLQNAP